MTIYYAIIKQEVKTVDNKQNFYLRNEEIISHLEVDNKTEFVTMSLKKAFMNYRDFIEYTRKRLNPVFAQSIPNKLTDLFSQNKLKNNTIFSGNGFSIFAAKDTVIKQNYETLEIDKIIITPIPKNIEISFMQTKNDFNDDDFCTTVQLVEE